MNAHQILAARIAVVARSTEIQHVSVCPNLKDRLPMCHVNHHRIHAIHHHADQTPNVLSCRMVSPNVRACMATLRVQIRFVAVSSRKIHANQIRVVLAHLVMPPEVRYVTVPSQQLEIHSENVYTPYLVIFVVQGPADVSTHDLCI